MHLTPISWFLFVSMLATWAILVVEVFASRHLFRRGRESTPEVWPSFSILKPLAGADDELWENLESHARISYPGEFEILLGVRSVEDLAYPIARKFARLHPNLVRVIIQEGEPGINPKVNQLITMTKYARFDVLALTDSNVRVPPDFLLEHAKYLAKTDIGLTANCFVGVGEESLGSALDNMTLVSFCLPNMATADVVLGIPQIVSKSLAIKRDALAVVGGWEFFKDLLAEDQRLGFELARAGYRTALCRTVVANVQKSHDFSYFWRRQGRWAMIRSRVLVPGFCLEPLVNPTLMGVLFALANPDKFWALNLALVSMAVSMAFTQVLAINARGAGFSLRWLLLVPLRDLLMFGAWMRGALMREVEWRGVRFKVGRLTQLSRIHPSPTSHPTRAV